MSKLPPCSGWVARHGASPVGDGTHVLYHRSMPAPSNIAAPSYPLLALERGTSLLVRALESFCGVAARNSYVSFRWFTRHPGLIFPPPRNARHVFPLVEEEKRGRREEGEENGSIGKSKIWFPCAAATAAAGCARPRPRPRSCSRGSGLQITCSTLSVHCLVARLQGEDVRALDMVVLGLVDEESAR